MKVISHALGALLAVFSLSGPAQADPRLTVVELFQSQGCSSCPPANANVLAIADRSEILALSFQVTYWDYLGWKDTFAKPAFTARQRDYALGLGIPGVYTPQVVINGRADLVGSDRAELETAIRRNVRPPDEPALTQQTGRITVSATRREEDVWLVMYDPRAIPVPIARGENGGRTLVHRNIVRDIVRLGRTSTRADVSMILLRNRDSALRAAVLVQDPGGGPIRAATRLTPF